MSKPDDDRVFEHWRRADDDARTMALKACPTWPLGEHEKFAEIYWSVMCGRGFRPYPFPYAGHGHGGYITRMTVYSL